jgi:hypothetical protein
MSMNNTPTQQIKTAGFRSKLYGLLPLYMSFHVPIFRPSFNFFLSFVWSVVQNLKANFLSFFAFLHLLLTLMLIHCRYKFMFG